MSLPGKAEVRPRQPLTDRQRDVLDVLERLWTADGPPTIRQICREIGIESTNGVVEHIQALVRKGWVIARAGERVGGPRAVDRSMILRITHARTWPWWTVSIHGQSAVYRTSIQAPDFAVAAVWTREDWHAIGAPDTLEGVEISFSPRAEPEFSGWQEVAS